MDDTKDELEFVFLPHRLSLYLFNEKFVMFKYNTPLKQIEVSTIRYIDNEQ